MANRIFYQEDCNLGLLDGKTIAIIGYGSQGHAHALNLKESGCNVIIGLYEGSKSWKRAEEQGFEEICHALADIATTHQDIQIVYPVHLNPNVREPVNRILGHVKNVILIDPQEYLPFVWLMNHAWLILTDSGGIQEEAPSLGKPVLVMRDTTERPEAVTAGTVRLVGTDKQRIVEEVTRLLKDENEYQAMSRAHNPYGDGQACSRILEALKNNRISL